MSAATIVGRIGAVGLLAAACTGNSPGAPPTEQNGFLIYGTDRTRQTVACDFRPIQLNGSRTDMQLTGECRFVRVTGARNDISVEVPPGGQIEITGEHNDVTWVQKRPGPSPVLLDRGSSNTFHRG